jgi:pentatricopeptide repeat protein
MAARGVARNQVTHATVVRAYIRARRFDLAEAALEEAGSAAGVESYGALVNGYSRAKQFDFAHGVLEQMKRDGVPANGIVYGDLMHRLVLDGQLRQALLVTRDMRRVGLPLKIAHYNSLLLGLGRGSHFPRAMSLLQEMHEAGVRPTVTSYNILLNAAAMPANGQDRVLEVLRAMRSDGLSPDAATFTSMLKSLGNEDPDRVRGLFKQAETTGVRPDQIMYNAFIGAFSRCGAFAEAEALVERMSSAGRAMRPDKITFASLSFGYFAAGRPADALKVYTRATESGAPLDAYFFNGFIENLVRARCYDDAVRVAGAAEQRGFEVDRGKFSELFHLRSDEEGSALERFKFWLGMPNQTYTVDWRAAQRPPQSSGVVSRPQPDFGVSLGRPQLDLSLMSPGSAIPLFLG